MGGMLGSLEKNKQEKVEEEELELLADCFMLEDVIRSQKLQAEITEGQAEVVKFQTSGGGLDKVKKQDIPEAPDKTLDLTPSLSGTQTLSLTGPGGEWKSEGVS